MWLVLIWLMFSVAFIQVGKSGSNKNAIATATFSKENSGVSGSIIIKGGKLNVNLDLTNLNRSKLPNINCFDNGINYHIHVKWNYSDNNDRVGSTSCASTFAGGHYDPWQACGPLTGNNYCNAVTSSSYACIPNGGSQGSYNCSNVTYPNNIFACEVGDWSGKYGVLNVNNNKTFTQHQSFWEVDAEDLIGRSVVLHCSTSGTPRFLCAPFVLSNYKNSQGNIIYNVQETEESSTKSTVYANYNHYGLIKLIDNGNVVINLKHLNEINKKCNNKQYNILIYDAWNDNNNNNYLIGNNCSSSIIGNIWDPTISCISGSQYDGIYCDNNGHTCHYNSSTYKCNYQSNAYSCAMSDISGKLYSMSNYNSNSNNNENKYQYSFIDEVLPRLNDVIGKSIVISCGENKNEKLLCGKITSSITSSDSSNSNSNSNSNENGSNSSSD